MQLTINIGYDQVFELVRQLPPRERKRLFLESEFTAVVRQTPEPAAFDEEYYAFLANFPVVSEEEIERILEVQKGLVVQNRRETRKVRFTPESSGNMTSDWYRFGNDFLCLRTVMERLLYLNCQNLGQFDPRKATSVPRCRPSAGIVSLDSARV